MVEVEKKSLSLGSKIEALLKSEKYRMLSSLFDGFISGLLFGVVVMAIIISGAVNVSLPTNLVIWLLLATMISVTILIWGIHKALQQK